MVSFRGPNLRVHRAFFFAPDRTLRAIVDFVNGPGRLRRLAHREILAFPVPHDVHTTPPRRERPHPDDASLVRRLEEMHTVLNVERFGGLLRPIAIRVSRRMKTRLGHYSPAIRIPGIVEVAAPEIAISRRHIKRHGWSDAFDTLLHEMVHQWQDENGLPLGHGPDFRQKAIAVGAIARAKRVRPGTAER